MNLIGNWTKTTKDKCGEKYPAHLRFDQNGIYQGEASPDATMHPVWDAGTYQVSGDSISLSTSNDAVIAYPAKMDHETIAFHDPDGCVIKYRKSH